MYRYARNDKGLYDHDMMCILKLLKKKKTYTAIGIMQAGLIVIR